MKTIAIKYRRSLNKLQNDIFIPIFSGLFLNRSIQSSKLFSVLQPFMSEKLCKNLNMLMTEARLNAGELSRRINLPASTIKKIRTHHHSNPTLSTLAPLAKYFSLTISQLVGDEPLPDTHIKGTYTIMQTPSNRFR